MKTLLTALAALLLASQAFAVGGSIGIYSNASAASCAIQQPAMSTYSWIAIVHTGSDGATGCAFSAPMPSCAGGVVIADQSWVHLYISSDMNPPPGPVVPSQTGASAGYGECFTGPVHVASMFYQAVSPVVGCCAWAVVANPFLGTPGPISTDCSEPYIQEEPANGGTAIISTNPTACPCNVGTQESTWGAVKELFRRGI